MDKQTLKIALIGYGRMGHMLHKIAEGRGHQIVLTIDSADDAAWDSPLWQDIDVAIEFTQPSVAYSNCLRLLEKGVAIVSGTTGWANELEDLKKQVLERGVSSLMWASNYSMGVNLFLEINRRVAGLMEHVGQYKVTMDETHHIHKLDAPSGTAITIAENIIQSMPSRLDNWHLAGEAAEASDRSLSITAHREGEVPGIHSVTYSSDVDRITLTHEAYGREGFAEGAVIAAEYIAGRQGVFTMNDLLNHFLEK